MNDCPSTLTLARWEAGTQPAGGDSIVEHLRQCARCAAFVGEVTTARRVVGDGVQATAAARGIAAAVRQRRHQQRAVQGRMAIALASVFLAGAAGFALMPKLGSSAARFEGAAGVRAKGGFLFDVYCKRGESVFPASDGGAFMAGDQLRFAYGRAEPGYLMIFSVDDRGRVFPYYEAGALKSVPAPAGHNVFLPGAVALDDHHGWERLFALWSDHPLDGQVVSQAVKDAFGERAQVRDRPRLEVAAEQISVLLRRP